MSAFGGKADMREWTATDFHVSNERRDISLFYAAVMRLEPKPTVKLLGVKSTNLKRATHGQSSKQADSREPIPKPQHFAGGKHPCRSSIQLEGTIQGTTNEPPQCKRTNARGNTARRRGACGLRPRNCRSTNNREERNDALRD